MAKLSENSPFDAIIFLISLQTFLSSYARLLSSASAASGLRFRDLAWLNFFSVGAGAWLSDPSMTSIAVLANPTHIPSSIMLRGDWTSDLQARRCWTSERLQARRHRWPYAQHQYLRQKRNGTHEHCLLQAGIHGCCNDVKPVALYAATTWTIHEASNLQLGCH